MAGGVSTMAKSVIENRPMTLYQFMIVLLCVMVNICDAFDNYVLGVVAPVIMKDLKIKPDVFGTLLGISSLGFVIGSMAIAPLGDKFGRRPTIVTLLGITAFLTLLTPLAPSTPLLMIARLLTGVCIGGIVASLSVIIIEFSNIKWGSFLLTNLYMSFIIGNAILSLIGRWTVEDYGWKAAFWISGGFNLAAFLACLFILPESISFLFSARPKNALAQVNKTYARMGLEPLLHLPPKSEADAANKVGIAAVLTPSLFAISLLIWLSSFAYYFSTAFNSGLGAQILVDIGIPLKDAVGLGVVTAPAQAVGMLVVGALASKVDPVKLTLGAIVLCSVGYVAYGLMPPKLPIVYVVACITGFSATAIFAGLIICVAKFYGAGTRNTVIGWTLGIGRLGHLLGSMAAGQMMSHHWDRLTMYSAMAAICLASGVALLASRIDVSPKRLAASPRELTPKET